ncbi:SIS domain-containing protein [Cohnella sp. CFH 77786]|uniref:MurR/RpiR family transcriptional regulator n=1 Tax=Cohnella sp. CFH 77786 TaxID=2662265 RepID=UPI001C6085B8|nr:MurR/RpiR family transcriptional regulator [Cohnella sp. CFH 77786]MBW5447972.1 SIS domain-containing protein [Cohnella sp. CFH 77786]
MKLIFPRKVCGSLSILSAIREKIDSLHPKERELAAFVLEQPQEAAQLNITELARRAGSSSSSVSRFCRTFHFRSFPEFKRKLAAELAGQAAPMQYQDIVAGNPLPDIVSAITANHLRSLSDTTQLLDLDQLRQAIVALHRASRIDLYGVATSGLVAQDFWSKLIRIGKAAASFSDPHMQLTSAASLTSRDVAVGISYSGETTATIHSLKCASEQGAVTISITRLGTNPLAALADIRLFTSSAEAGMRRGDMASRMAALHVVDILFTGLVSEHFGEYVPRLERSFQTVRKYTGKEERNPR